jgi:hypothetical protein
VQNCCAVGVPFLVRAIGSSVAAIPPVLQRSTLRPAITRCRSGDCSVRPGNASSPGWPDGLRARRCSQPASGRRVTCLTQATYVTFFHGSPPS